MRCCEKQLCIERKKNALHQKPFHRLHISKSPLNSAERVCPENKHLRRLVELAELVRYVDETFSTS